MSRQQTDNNGKKNQKGNGADSEVAESTRKS
jgi:hypothetical protein